MVVCRNLREVFEGVRGHLALPPATFHCSLSSTLKARSCLAHIQACLLVNPSSPNSWPTCFFATNHSEGPEDTEDFGGFGGFEGGRLPCARRRLSWRCRGLPD